ncbi:DUF2169 family type VI secretion system accessory protein [Rhizobium leguminosarum]|uniref:DUF2169 domain-containing protein n=1 Tax=Rhizobium leguminosarum TaxID=384 RepID=A0A2K9ZD90_RHILE|nr:DUF2169 domain-containing protein [Rhizobium leguminosarum]AUW46223.1 hypothetical protein CUJ84_pRLN1000768 [Rhizobium leguminosarum]
MSVDNDTPFPVLAFRQYNLTGDLLGVVVARGTFKLSNGGPLVLDDSQRPLAMSDVYDGDPHQAPQMACTDLAPYKPGTDVTFLGATFAPNGVSASSWTCGLKVGPLEKRLRVYGPRQWRARTRKTWRGLIDPDKEDALDSWELTEGEAVAHVPIDWRLAFGGRIEGGEVFEKNPLGIGLVDETSFAEKPEWPAPQIEDEAHPIRHVGDRPAPAGFGPISPFWEGRLKLAGTYDDVWLKERHPFLPKDFDFHFWQAAHPDLISEPWLRGDEEFELDHLLPGRDILRGQLPGIDLHVDLDQGDGLKRGILVLDGVHFDMRPDVGRVFLTWRTAFPWPERRGKPRLSLAAPVQWVA